MKYKAIIFDLDGTLVDSLEEIATCCNSVIKNRGFKGHSLDAYRVFVGDGASELIRRVLPAGTQVDMLEKCYHEFIELYKTNCCKIASLYKGIPELLDLLSDRGIKMAILSNKTQTLTEKAATTLLASWKFEPVFGLRNHVPRKPDPTGAFEISKTLDIEPSQFLYLGDTAVDMKTAIAAGMLPVAALWGFRDQTELRKNGAKVLIENPLDILALFNQ